MKLLISQLSRSLWRWRDCVSLLGSTAEEPGRGGRGFTRDPSQLQGTILKTALRKSPQGFGFTIIGGDRPDEFLQVKNVLPDGPAAHDKKIASGRLTCLLMWRMGMYCSRPCRLSMFEVLACKWHSKFFIACSSPAITCTVTVAILMHVAVKCLRFHITVVLIAKPLLLRINLRVERRE